MILPKTYSRSTWERSKVAVHEKHIGKPMLSWSQIETWFDKKGFNTGRQGKEEYMLKYFFGDEFPDMGWAQFGQEVEDYICYKNNADKFTEDERKVLDTIQPLGCFQREVVLNMGDFVVLGYIDDHSEDMSIIRDYKTKSKSSKKDLHSTKKHQIPLYAAAFKQEGFDVKKAEYVIIERLGGRECMMGGGRESLSVGGEVWYEEFDMKGREKKALAAARQAAEEISIYYQAFKKLNG